jgi:alkyl hydroperoxide reductase subunit AhpC
MTTDRALARIRELVGPDHELGANPEQVDELIDLVRALDFALEHGEPLPRVWSERPGLLIYEGRTIPAVLQRG